MSYTVCPNCGQNALSVATRCPRCGVAFESQFIRHAAPRPRRGPLGLVLAGVILTLLAGNALWQRFGVAPPPPPVVRQPAPPPPAAVHPRPPRESVAAIADSPLPAPGEAPSVAVTPAPSHAESAAPVVAPPVKPVAAPAPITTAGAKTLYTSTWLNLRSDRRNSAPVLRVLKPGEAVSVDSLSRGWYRVVSDAEQPGWVDRRLLDTLPPQPRPAAHQ